MFGVPDPDPTHFIEAYLEIIFKKILLSKKKKNILTTGTVSAIFYFTLPVQFYSTESSDLEIIYKFFSNLSVLLFLLALDQIISDLDLDPGEDPVGPQHCING